MIMKDDHIIVLDFLLHGKPGDRRAEPLVQGIGDKYFNILEVVLKDDVNVKAGDKIYIGDDKREQVKYIRGRILYSDLTSFSKTEVDKIIEDIIDADEKRFVDFFNKSGSLSTRMHTLELLHGVGKKHLWEIIDERKTKPFETFKELHERVPMLSDPKKMVISRIMDELEEKDSHKLFVASAGFS